MAIDRIKQLINERGIKADTPQLDFRPESPCAKTPLPEKRRLHLRRDWVWLTAALMLLCLAISFSPVFHRADLQFFDIASSFAHRAVAKKIALIAVDDRTVQYLGGWPFDERIHARLIDRLTEDKAAAVGFDLTTARAAQATDADREALADAIKRNGRVVTRLALRDRSGAGLSEQTANHGTGTAYASGHTVWLRNEDGIVRGFHMFAGAAHRYRHMSALVLESAGFKTSACADAQAPGAAGTPDDCVRYVPLGSPRSYDTYSYLDVLYGQVPASRLAGRIVLVGATAHGIATRLATPTDDGSTLTSVEFLAETINASIATSLIRPTSRWGQLIFSESAIPLICLVLYFLGPRTSLFASIVLAGMLAVGSIAMLRFGHFFLSPCADILICMIAYPLLAWRRQEVLLSYLSMETAKGTREPSLPEEPTPVKLFDDPIQRQLSAAACVFDRIRRHREFISAWVDSLPEATLVTTPEGKVILANERVKALCQTSELRRAERVDPAGRAVSDVLFEITASHRANEFASQALARFALWSGAREDPRENGDSMFERGIEVTNARQGRTLLIKCAQIEPSALRVGALIFHVADVSSVRKAERQRDTALRFLSHDMRSPQVAILALIEQMQHDPPRFTAKEFATLVGRYATTALSLADDFLFLARAESLPPTLTHVDPALVLGDAIDDLWPQASARSTTVTLVADPGKNIIADVQLLRRAFGNLIGNAIKFSPRYSNVEVQLAETDRHLKISVVDRGVGIPDHKIRSLFHEFSQLDERFSRSGHGLGLVFVKTVVDALRGKLQVHSKLGEGTTFVVLLPKIGGDGAPGHPD